MSTPQATTNNPQSPAWALTPSLVRFSQALRAAGLTIGSGETQDALTALACVDAAVRDQFRLALRQTLAKHQEDQAVFDRVFQDFWQIGASEPEIISAETENADDVKGAPSTPGDARTAAIADSGKAVQTQHRDDRTSGASQTPRLMQRDFADVSDAEMAELRELINLIGKRLANRVGRRWRTTRQGAVDLRATLRASLARGGELWQLKHRRRRPQRLNLVVMADVSHSMDSYSRFFLQFIYAFQDIFRRMDTFVFSTHLSRVTDALRRGRLEQALDALPDAVEDWAGGTRIAESIAQLLKNHGDNLLSQHTLVMIVSDGWDTATPDELDEQLRRLRQRCRKILWLDPLRDHPGFFASAAGMHTDSRWVDHCLAARDLNSLRALAAALEKTA